MSIDASLIKAMFTNTIDNVVSHLKTLMAESSVSGTETILMVGGFSDSAMLQDAVRTNFPDKQLIIPREAGLVVLKGAVVFGHCPSSVGERVCRYTYGVEMRYAFEEGVHDASKKITSDDGSCLCDGIFDKHVQRGQILKFGVAQSSRYYIPSNDNDKHIHVTLYASMSKDAMYVTDPRVIKNGLMTVPVKNMSIPRTERGFMTHLTFSGTEIAITAEEKKTGKFSSVKMDFLG